MGQVIGLELRALWLHNISEYHPLHLPHLGLNCWSPNINVLRDARWGRAMEVVSEDPHLTGVYGAQITLGIHNNTKLDSRYLQALATIKHFVANLLEGHGVAHGEVGRHSVNMYRRGLVVKCAIRKG